MKVRFMGAAGTVTGSSYVLTSGSGRSILIDLGMFQGVTEVDALNYQPYEYDCRQLIGAILTHAHLDHCGRLPILLPRGYQGDIWMTTPTRDLTELSLLDTAKIAEQDKKKALFDKPLAYETFRRFKTTDYRSPVQVGDFTVTFRDAGHIVGSAILEIVDNHPDSSIHKIVFSGDLGNTPEELVKATEIIEEADAVVMESTYGDRLHSAEDASVMLQNEINAVEKNGGTLLIPAFALERTQEILHMIMHLKKDGKILEDTPVFLDSPMAEKATNIYLQHLEVFNVHIQKEMVEHGSVFGFPGLDVIDKRSESQMLHRMEGAKVIIAGSGMMTGGRIMGHAANYLSDSTNRLLIVGYQGEDTLGRKLLEGDKQIMIDGHAIDVKAAINMTQALSSHADQGQLIDWLRNIRNVKKIFLTHGEDGPRNALAKKISEDLGHTDITLPKLHEEVLL